MRRSFRFGALEIVAPVVAAIVIGVVLLIVLAPRVSGSQSGNSGRIRIYSSVPMENAGSSSLASIVHGIQMAIDEAGGRAGNFQVELVTLEGASASTNGWTAEIELANARRAAEDPDAMVYIGTYNSGAAKISIPVLNRVNMAMISPGNTYPGLTKPGTGDAGEPYNYYPLGTRNYFRVVPADDLQGSAAAAYANQLGIKSVYVLDDTELYGVGLARIFAASVATFGIEVKGGPESIDVRADDYRQLAEKILATNPDMVYFGGNSPNHPDMVLRDLRAAGYNGAFMGGDAMADQSFADKTSVMGENIYGTTVGLPANQLTGAGAAWYQQYYSHYYNDLNQDWASFGYEAGKVAMHAIETVNRKDREAIRAAVASTTSENLSGILGDWKFDANGDTSLVNISVLHKTDSGSNPWQYQGLMVYEAASKTWQFQQAQ